MAMESGQIIRSKGKLYQLCFSPDDEDLSGKGWYLQEMFNRWRTSQLFKAPFAAVVELKFDKMIWG
jgi:hypothetical protein